MKLLTVCTVSLMIMVVILAICLYRLEHREQANHEYHAIREEMLMQNIHRLRHGQSVEAYLDPSRCWNRLKYQWQPCGE